jgi:HPr kinase/phosphorylase
VERMPEPRKETLLDIELPAVSLAPFEASAAAKLRRFALLIEAP